MKHTRGAVVALDRTVTVVDQGAHLDAIRANGTRTQFSESQMALKTAYAANLRAVARVATKPARQDLVLLAVKAYTIAAVATPQYRRALFDDHRS